MYHNVDAIAHNVWWVTPETFRKQLATLRKFDFVYLDDYDPSNPDHVVLTIDDGYENIYQHGFPLLKCEAIPFELFVIGDRLGEWNDFDEGEECRHRLACPDQLLKMGEGGGRIQWHTRTHRDLRTLSDVEVENELTVPADLRARFGPPHFRWFAYPYGWFDQRSLAMARLQFSGAVATETGDLQDRWQLPRVRADERFTAM
jgi:peptidoglycan/xylan/chitin deacetylase (PgdA/CDA1 family)